MKPATQVLIERYQKHLYAIAFNICRNQQDAEDVVQDTFIQYHMIPRRLLLPSNLECIIIPYSSGKERTFYDGVFSC